MARHRSRSVHRRSHIRRDSRSLSSSTERRQLIAGYVSVYGGKTEDQLRAKDCRITHNDEDKALFLQHCLIHGYSDKIPPSSTTFIDLITIEHPIPLDVGADVVEYILKHIQTAIASVWANVAKGQHVVEGRHGKIEVSELLMKAAKAGKIKWEKVVPGSEAYTKWLDKFDARGRCFVPFLAASTKQRTWATAIRDTMSRLVRGGFITNGKQATVVPSRAKISSSPKQKSKTKQTKKRSVRSSSGSPEARPIYPADVAKWKLNKKWHKVMLNCIKDAQESQKFDHGGSGSPSTVTDHIEAAMKLLTINSKGKGKGKQMKNIFVFRPDVDYTGWAAEWGFRIHPDHTKVEMSDDEVAVKEESDCSSDDCSSDSESGTSGGEDDEEAGSGSDNGSHLTV